VARLDEVDFALELAEAQARARVAEASLAKAGTELDAGKRNQGRVDRLAAERLVADQEVDELQSRVERLRAEADVAKAQVAEARARTRLIARRAAEARIVAPFAGRIAARYLDPGAYLQPGTPVVRLVAAGPLRVKLRVPEVDLARVAVGQRFRFTAPATGATEFAGAVVRVSGEVSAADRAVAVEGVLDAEEPRLLRGMFGRVSIDREQVTDALLAPATGLVTRLSTRGDEEQGVFVVVGEQVRWRPVRVTGRTGDRVAVVGELEPQAPLVTVGHERLSDGDRVNVVKPAASQGRP